MGWPTLAVDVSFGTNRFATPSYSTLTSTDVTALDVVRGRKSELEGSPPGTLAVDLDNRTRKYDPRYASGTYYPNLTPGKKVRVTATYDQFAGAAAVSYVAAGALASGDNVSLSPALPAGWLADRDLFVCLASIRNSGTGTVNVPDDWFNIVTFGNMALLGHYAITGDVAPTITFTGGATGDTTLAQIIALRDCETDPANLVIASATSLNASAQNIAVPALTVGEGGVVLIAGWKQDDWTGVGALAGQFFTEAIDASSTTGNDAGHVLDYRVQTGALNVSATTLTVTGGANAISRSIVVGLRPFRGRKYEIFNGWTTAWPNESDRWAGTATMRATGPFGFLARTKVPDPYTAAIEADTPTAWYRLSDSAGHTLTDSSGNDHHGAWFPDFAEISTTTGLIVSDDGAVTLPAAPKFAVGKIPAAVVPHLRPLSIEFWIQVDKVPKSLPDPLDLSSQNWSVILKGGGPVVRIHSVDAPYPGAIDWIETDREDLVTANIATATTLYDPGFGTVAASVCDGNRHHVVCTTNSAGTVLNIYVDGTDRAPYNNFVGTLPTTGAYSTIDLNYAGGWDGTAVLDELAFYDAELTLTEVAVHFAAGARPGADDKTGARIGRVLDLIDWPAGLRDLDTGQTGLGIAFGMAGSKALDYLDLVAASEQGLLSEAHDDDGNVRFQDRARRLTDIRSATAQTLFSDQASDIASNSAVVYSAIDLATDDRPAANVVTVKWAGGDEVARDQTSVDAYGEIPASVDTLLTSRDEAQSLAQFILNEQASLFTRIRGITLRPGAANGTAADRAWMAALARREGDRVRVVHQPASTGTAIDQQLWIIGVEHHADNGVHWETTFHLAPAITTAYWILGTSQLGTNTRLAY
jgi:hypothetical protein